MLLSFMEKEMFKKVSREAICHNIIASASNKFGRMLPAIFYYNPRKGLGKGPAKLQTHWRKK